MLEYAIIFLRIAQFGGAAILFGSSLFFLYALPRAGAGSATAYPWPPRLLAGAAAAVLAGSLMGLLVQTCILAGSVSEGMRLSSLSAVITTMSMGPSTLVRGGAEATVLMVLSVVRSVRLQWWSIAALGGLIGSTFAWMGHGAASEGAAGVIHLLADILHTLAASLWIGALVVFFILLRPRPAAEELDRVLHKALQGFAGVGTALVAVLVATGLVNSWFLVGPEHLLELWTTPYGQLLSLKLALFTGMLGLAAANRFRLTPALGVAVERKTPTVDATLALRRSLVCETALAFGVLALVAWIGTLAPVSAK